ncbi:MAG: SDR family NAD(P)-dependent oxidoreductase [Sphingomonadales bacterium]|nr:SDR family NAD(P)-dependent oxidoreductase [Sphingomonadales bacterium]
MGEALVAVVTGASRGAGRGIAIALGGHGCTVYVTGRSARTGDARLPGTIYETADAVTAAGGKGVAVRVDHGDDDQVRALFDQVRAEQGRLDILVNNACAVHDRLVAPGRFWEKPLEIGDMITVGVRSGFAATHIAAPLLLERERALVVFTSSSGSVHYMLNPAYGAHKAGIDKLAADMGYEFRGTGVAALSIWMGGLITDRVKEIFAADPAKYAHMEGRMETPEFTGHVIWALFNDPDLMALSGQTVIGAEMGEKYGVLDEGGNRPPSCRATHGDPRIQSPHVIQ